MPNELKPCPYAEYIKRLADEHFDCLDCPASECKYPEFFKRRADDEQAD